ncbi:N-acetylmuramoyl-L-alanine amidase [Aquimarina litoralis]|uniref:N-acetylmuramoyl-L-alanine amidase n=2 Tax=Aquimarina litoralis TaxID=584605 RepID=A0ABN1J1L5_9FLAO
MSFFYFNSIAQVIVIDPGHGYAVDGSNPDGRTDIEHSTALAVGLKLKEKIESRCNGWTVRLTRSTRNGHLSLGQRRAISNNWNADRFISIHCNAGGGTGTETFWCNRSNSSASSNSRFSRDIQNHMVNIGKWTDRRSVEDASFIFHLGVLTNNNAIGVLNEIGFVDSPDANKLLSNNWRDTFAEAYLKALESDLERTCVLENSDYESPVTSMTAVGGSIQSDDFTVNFSDSDNIGVTGRYYQVLEKYGDTYLANRGNGFFNDNYGSFYSGYQKIGGSWSISNNHLLQSDISLDNTNLSSFLSQTSLRPYLYEFDARILSTSGPRKFGLHIMASDVRQSQRGNSYLIWFSGEDNKVRIYETINNRLYFRAIGDVSLNNLYANYKIEYNPLDGRVNVFRNNKQVLSWQDSTPIKTGSGISYRTNSTRVEFDDLKVYKQRSSSAKVTVGSSNINDARTRNVKIKSLARDKAGNWSKRGNLDVVVTTNRSQSTNLSITPEELRRSALGFTIYPNPINGSNFYIQNKGDVDSDLDVTILNLTGKKVLERHFDYHLQNVELIDLSKEASLLKSGQYFIKITTDDTQEIISVIKK